MRHADIELEPGTYVIAVSGGVDSMVLLDLLQQKPGLNLVVAHFDHGIRLDSHLDKQLVQDIVKKHGLTFVHHRAELGPAASEEAARKARYDFLHKVRRASGAKAIITAHHYDDLVETVIHNLLRGTGRLGLSSLANESVIVRPLLKVSKSELQEYGKNQGLIWRDDPTNQDIKYRRNYIRHRIVPRLGPEGRKKLKELINRAHGVNQELDKEIAKVLQTLEDEHGLKRGGFIKLPYSVSSEVIAAWLRLHGIRQFDRKVLEKLVVAAKTLQPGKKADIDGKHTLNVTKTHLKVSEH